MYVDNYGLRVLKCMFAYQVSVPRKELLRHCCHIIHVHTINLKIPCRIELHEGTCVCINLHVFVWLVTYSSLSFNCFFDYQRLLAVRSVNYHTIYNKQHQLSQHTTYKMLTWLTSWCSYICVLHKQIHEFMDP